MHGPGGLRSIHFGSARQPYSIRVSDGEPDAVVPIVAQYCRSNCPGDLVRRLARTCASRHSPGTVYRRDLVTEGFMTAHTRHVHLSSSTQKGCTITDCGRLAEIDRRQANFAAWKSQSSEAGPGS